MFARCPAFFIVTPRLDDCDLSPLNDKIDWLRSLFSAYVYCLSRSLPKDQLLSIMASAANIVEVFVGTTTASNQDSAAVFTWDLSSSPAESTPTAAPSRINTSTTDSIPTRSSANSELLSSSTSSNAVAKQTDLPQQSPPAYQKSESTKHPPGLYISLIVLSVVVIVTAVVVGWLAWRRCRQHRKKETGKNLGMMYRDSSKSLPVPQTSAGRQSSNSGMTGPTLVSEQDWHVVTPTHLIDPHCRPGRPEKGSALAESLSHTRSRRGPCSTERPHITPAKQNGTLPPCVPPSSPTFPRAMGTPRRSSRYRGAATQTRIPSPPLLELRRFSPISPLPGGPD